MQILTHIGSLDSYLASEEVQRVRRSIIGPCDSITLFTPGPITWKGWGGWLQRKLEQKEEKKEQRKAKQRCMTTFRWQGGRDGRCSATGCNASNKNEATKKREMVKKRTGALGRTGFGILNGWLCHGVVRFPFQSAGDQRHLFVRHALTAGGISRAVCALYGRGDAACFFDLDERLVGDLFTSRVYAP